MSTIEQYWLDCESFGFTKSPIDSGYRFSLPEHLGIGGYTIIGDLSSYVISITDVLFYEPCVMLESTHEKYLEFSQYYEGSVHYYDDNDTAYPIDYGLNYIVNYPFFTGYKHMAPHRRLICVGITYREAFFDMLPYALPDNFWEAGADVLNPDAIVLPSISLICEQLRNTKLTGKPLEIFLYGKALEAFGTTLHYIYSNKKELVVSLSNDDKAALKDAKELILSNIDSPPTIDMLSRHIGIGRQKLMSGFKHINGMTIGTYIKKVRMEKAANMLAHTDLPIAEIAEQIGYKGDGHFQEVFKSIYGITPSGLRRELR